MRAGIFIPSLAVGAALGRLVGAAVDAALAAAGSAMTVSLPAYAVRPHAPPPLCLLAHRPCASVSAVAAPQARGPGAPASGPPPTIPV
jgi:hypothetical protein